MPAEIRNLREEDLSALFAMRQVSYQDDSDFSDPEVRERHAGRLSYTRGCFVEGQLASAAVMFPFTLHLAGRNVPAGGLASVLTAPEHRRQGYVRALLRDGLERLRDAGTGWCLEYPFDPFYYAKFGWQSMGGGYSLRLPIEKLWRAGAKPPAEHVTGSVSERLPTFASLYENWAQDYNFSLLRDGRARPDWNSVFADSWSGRKRFAYLLPDAYCVVELRHEEERQTLHVHDYAFETPAGRRALLDFCGNFHGQADTVELRLPPGDPLLLDARRHLAPRQSQLQARVVDVPLALAPLPSRDEPGFHLRVRDDFCPWNDGVFRLELGDTGTVAEPSSREPELSLDVRTMAALVAGALNPREAGKAGLLQGDLRCAEVLASLSGGRKPFMARADFF